MDMETVTPDEMRAAQVVTLVALALYLGARYVPGQAHRIRVAAVVFYLLAVAVFMARLLLR